MDPEDSPRKRLKVDDGYVPSPSPSPIRFGTRSATPALNSMVLHEPMAIKHDPVSLTELVTSRTVTINVGPEQSTINVSTSLFQGISQPLHQMLNSIAVAEGDTSEINRYLQNDDKDAFLQLISLAYDRILKGPQADRLITLSSPVKNSETPTSTFVDLETPALKTVKCRDCDQGSIWMDVKCDSPKSTCKAPRLEVDYGLKFFLELQLTQSHQVAAYVFSKQFPQIQAPNPINSATGKPYPLIRFAKVFSLAAKWQVQSLQGTSLLGFQNRLRRYIKAGPDEKTLEELLDVLRYLASMTVITTPIEVAHQAEPENPGAGQVLGTSMLLKSLMRYICVHISTLLQDLEFRQIVAEHGVIGLMAMDVLAETMVASKGDE